MVKRVKRVRESQGVVKESQEEKSKEEIGGTRNLCYHAIGEARDKEKGQEGIRSGCFE